MTSKEFLTHLYTQVWKYIIEENKFWEYWNSREDAEYDPSDFYSDVIPELLSNLKKGFPLDKTYKDVIGKIPTKIRPKVIQFMSWVSNVEHLSANDIFNKMHRNQLRTKPLDEFAKFVESSKFPRKSVRRKKEKESIDMIFTAIDKFSTAAKPLLYRRRGKSAIKLDDEYDIQDILHAILKPYFPSIKSEKVISSKGKRFLKIDFLIASEKIGVECKFIKAKTKIDKIKAQLNDDIQTYHLNQDCSQLIFFLYDKNQNITDPDSLEEEYTTLQKFGKKKMYIYLRIRPKN